MNVYPAHFFIVVSVDLGNIEGHPNLALTQKCREDIESNCFQVKERIQSLRKSYRISYRNICSKIRTLFTAIDGKRSVIVIDYGTNLGHRPTADWKDIMWQTSHAEHRD